MTRLGFFLFVLSLFLGMPVVEQFTEAILQGEQSEHHQHKEQHGVTKLLGRVEFDTEDPFIGFGQHSEDRYVHGGLLLGT